MSVESKAGAHPSAGAPVELLLLGYPVVLGALQQEHTDELLRELSLLVISRDQADSSLRTPRRLLEMSDMLVAAYSAELNSASQRREEALRRGEVTMDISYPVVPGAREIIAQYRQASVEMDEFCEQGDLLTLTTPAPLRELRHWMLGEMLDQLDGAAPRRWAGPTSL